MAIERIEAEQKRESGSYKDKDSDEPEPKRELLKARDYRVSSSLSRVTFERCSVVPCSSVVLLTSLFGEKQLSIPLITTLRSRRLTWTVN